MGLVAASRPPARFARCDSLRGPSTIAGEARTRAATDALLEALETEHRRKEDLARELAGLDDAAKAATPDAARLTKLLRAGVGDVQGLLVPQRPAGAADAPEGARRAAPLRGLRRGRAARLPLRRAGHLRSTPGRRSGDHEWA